MEQELSPIWPETDGRDPIDDNGWDPSEPDELLAYCLGLPRGVVANPLQVAA